MGHASTVTYCTVIQYYCSRQDNVSMKSWTGTSMAGALYERFGQDLNFNGCTLAPNEGQQLWCGAQIFKNPKK